MKILEYTQEIKNFIGCKVETKPYLHFGIDDNIGVWVIWNCDTQQVIAKSL